MNPPATFARMDDPLQLFLFDDAVARAWEPFALTRPAGELLFGMLTLRGRAEQIFGRRCTGQLAAEHLEGFSEPGAPPVYVRPPAETRSPRLFLLSRFLPAWEARRIRIPQERSGPILAPEGEIVGWLSARGEPAPEPDFFQHPASEREPVARLPGRILEQIWKVLLESPEQIGQDFAALHPEAPGPELPAGSFHFGAHPLAAGDGVRIEPGVVFDTTNGPIWLDEGVAVRAFTRLAGPAYIGPGSVLLGGSIEAVSVGPVCRLRGELAESVCLGYVNKQHDGHIGHAYLGRWVNLGAETTNSDLKNNYGSIRLELPRGPVDTGEIKLGSLIGDHVKTGIGLLLNTGTVIGAGSNLHGAAMPPKYVPPFSWGSGAELVEFRLERFLEVAERALARRHVELTPGMREQLVRSWEHGRTPR